MHPCGQGRSEQLARNTYVCAREGAVFAPKLLVLDMYRIFMRIDLGLGGRPKVTELTLEGLLVVVGPLVVVSRLCGYEGLATARVIAEVWFIWRQRLAEGVWQEGSNKWK